jgi:hypothetical protein
MGSGLAASRRPGTTRWCETMARTHDFRDISARAARANRGEDRMPVLPFIEEKLPWAVRHGKLTWVVKYASLSVALLVLIVVVSRHVLGLDALSYTDPIGIAAILGLIGVIGLGVALMAATFYSARSGMDEEAGDARDVHYDEKRRNRPD